VQENTTLYRIGLSLAGAVSTGLFGLVAGAVWGLAVNAQLLLAMAAGGGAAALIGAVTVQLTPTGGVIMENKTTVNYALIATYGWIAAFLCFFAAIVWLVRVLLS
jgi:hypothetical protein